MSVLNLFLLQSRLQSIHEKWCKSKTRRAQELKNLNLVLKLVEKLLQYKDGLHCVCTEDVCKVGIYLPPASAVEVIESEPCVCEHSYGQTISPMTLTLGMEFNLDLS